jgi:hypothetical protein
LQFVPPTTDRVSAQAGRPNHGLDSAPALLQGQQAYKATAVLLVQGRQHAIDRSVLVRHSAVRMLLTLLTGTHMHTPSNRVFHDRSPCLQPGSKLTSHKHNVSLHQTVKLFFDKA